MINSQADRLVISIHPLRMIPDLQYTLSIVNQLSSSNKPFGKRANIKTFNKLRISALNSETQRLVEITVIKSSIRSNIDKGFTYKIFGCYIFSKNILIAFLLLAALSIAPVVYNKIRRKQEN
jgi:hypothetical protein